MKGRLEWIGSEFLGRQHKVHVSIDERILKYLSRDTLRNILECCVEQERYELAATVKKYIDGKEGKN